MPSRLTIIIHVIISLLILAAGIYSLIEKKIIIAGKYTGGLQHLEFPGNVLVALSFFFASAFVILVLVDRKKPYIKQICEGFFLISLVLLVIGVMM